MIKFDTTNLRWCKIYSCKCLRTFGSFENNHKPNVMSCPPSGHGEPLAEVGERLFWDAHEIIIAWWKPSRYFEPEATIVWRWPADFCHLTRSIRDISLMLRSKRYEFSSSKLSQALVQNKTWAPGCPGHEDVCQSVKSTKESTDPPSLSQTTSYACETRSLKNKQHCPLEATWSGT